MRKLVMSLCVIVLILVHGVCAGSAAATNPLSAPSLASRSVEKLEADGLQFKDLNKNGKLDPYEDWRLPAEKRASDLLGQMSAEEKAAQMVHMTLVQPKEAWFRDTNVGFALVYHYLAAGATEAAAAVNQIQEWCEASRLGIPIILSMDSVNGASWVKGATIFPDQMGLGAAGDASLVRRVAEAQREEMMAMGVRMSLSPVADLATEPRWARVQECFGESSAMAADMVAAAVQGLQAGAELSPESVLACVKHFPGSGPQADGKDGSVLEFDEASLANHLSVFEAAINAGAGSIMPYGYSKVPFLGGDAVQRPAHESSVVMTGLLREKMGYEGLIQTDWGMKHVDAAIAGADILGGAGQREVARLATGVPANEIDDRVHRILSAKFRLGLFENPYVDEERAAEIVGADEHKALAFEAAARSLTLLKDAGVPSLAGRRLLVAGTLADDADALSSGWKVPGNPGQSILEALRGRAGEASVTYVQAAADVGAGSAVVIAPGNIVAVLVVGEKAGTHDPAWGYKTLEFPDEQMELARACRAAGIPVVSVVLLGRPYVMTELMELSDAVIVAYRPGVTEGAAAVAAALFGEAPITGKLPVQIPRSMEQVLSQREDLPGDIADPLFDIGFGLEADSFGYPSR